MRMEGNGKLGPTITDPKCLVDHWLKEGKDVKGLQNLCDEHGVIYWKASLATQTQKAVQATSKKVMATLLEEKFQLEWHTKAAELLTVDVADDDHSSNRLQWSHSCSGWFHTGSCGPSQKRWEEQLSKVSKTKTR